MRRTHIRWRRDVFHSVSGFTLFELLVVLVIIGMISAVVVPRLTGSLTNLHLKTATKKVVSALRYARSQATSDNMIHLATFDVEKQRLIISRLAADDMGAPAGLFDTLPNSENKTRIYELPEHVAFDFTDNECSLPKGNPYRIFFYPNGSCSGCGMVSLVNARKFRYDIEINFITGSIKLRV